MGRSSDASSSSIVIVGLATGKRARGHPPLNCRDAREDFIALFDGKLGLTERTPLEVHVARCRECWRKLESLGNKASPQRAIWRARLALDSLSGSFDVVSPVRLVSLFRGQVLSRVPSSVFLVAASVTVMVVLVTYGVQRRTELGTALGQGAPEASPVRESMMSPEPAAQPEPPSMAPSTIPAPTDAAHPRTQLNSRDRSRTGPMAKLRGVAPDAGRPAVSATVRLSQLGPGAPWVMGHTKDEQNAPETETVRQDRD